MIQHLVDDDNDDYHYTSVITNLPIELRILYTPHLGILASADRVLKPPLIFNGFPSCLLDSAISI